MPPSSRAAPAVVLALALAGCTQTSSNAVAVAPPPPEGGCGSYLPAFRTQIDADAGSGNLARDTYSRATQDLAQAETACSAGREQQARLIYLSTRRTYGYP